MMFLRLISSLSRDKFHPVVISLTDKNRIGEHLEERGISVYPLNMSPVWPSLRNQLYLHRLLSELQVDLIHGWMYHANVVASIQGYFYPSKTPIVWSVRHSLYDIKYEKPITRLVIRVSAPLSRHVSMVIYNSTVIARQHELFGYDSSKTRIIPNGFDTDKFCPNESARAVIRGELDLSKDAVLIGLVARYHPMKDHWNFLNAAVLLLKDFPKIYFVLVGSGIDQRNAELKTMAGNLGIDDHVILLDKQENMARLTAALDIASSSSYGEGFPNVIGEAMCCGVPCIATDVGDSAFIIGNTGRIVPPRNPQALAAAWKELVELGIEGRQELGMQARQRVVENFTLTSVVKQYENLYEKLITRVKD